MLSVVRAKLLLLGIPSAADHVDAIPMDHLEGKPCQWIVLSARNDRENAECDEQTSRSNHFIAPRQELRCAFRSYLYFARIHVGRDRVVWGEGPVVISRFRVDRQCSQR